jgi:hypothetical protein
VTLEFQDFLEPNVSWDSGIKVNKGSSLWHRGGEDWKNTANLRELSAIFNDWILLLVAQESPCRISELKNFSANAVSLNDAIEEYNEGAIKASNKSTFNFIDRSVNSVSLNILNLKLKSLIKREVRVLTHVSILTEFSEGVEKDSLKEELTRGSLLSLEPVILTLACDESDEDNDAESEALYRESATSHKEVVQGTDVFIEVVSLEEECQKIFISPEESSVNSDAPEPQEEGLLVMKEMFRCLQTGEGPNKDLFLENPSYVEYAKLIIAHFELKCFEIEGSFLRFGPIVFNSKETKEDVF